MAAPDDVPPDLPSGTHVEVCAMRRYRPSARRVRAYVHQPGHQPDDLADLATAVRSWLMMREAM